MTNTLYAQGRKLSYLTRAAKLHARYMEFAQAKNDAPHKEGESEVTHAGNYGSDEISLRSMLKSGEVVKAKVYGYSTMGFVLMTITNERLIMIYKKFLFEDIKEFTLDSVTGINYDKRFTLIDVTISTRVKDYNIWLFNTARAYTFIREIEEQYIRTSLLRRPAS